MVEVLKPWIDFRGAPAACAVENGSMPQELSLYHGILQLSNKQHRHRRTSQGGGGGGSPPSLENIRAKRQKFGQ